MRRVFLSHSFTPRDRVLVAHVEALLRSHGLVAVNGRVLGGGPLTPEVSRFIEGCDAMVALLTVRENDPGNITHPWVLQEFGHARLSGMTAIGLYETGVPVQGADAGFEHVDVAPGDQGPAFIRLSEIIGEWKRRAGRPLKVMVMPPNAAQPLGQRADQVRCECRFLVDGRDTPWHPVERVTREIGGVFVHLRVPDDVEAIQIRTDGPPLESAYTPLWPAVQFDPRV